MFALKENDLRLRYSIDARTQQSLKHKCIFVVYKHSTMYFEVNKSRWAEQEVGKLRLPRFSGFKKV
jgi:hypothetical protein